MKKLAISIGDINGVGLEIALRAHEKISKICKPVYCINKTMLEWGSAMLSIDIPKNFKTKECGEVFEIKPGVNTKEAGEFSYDSFITAIALAKSKQVCGIVTLPINKASWALAGIKYKGHTDALADLLGCETVMMLGCEDMYIILYTHHISIREISSHVEAKKIYKFLINIYDYIESDNIAVLALNPHAGDDGVIGNEDIEIEKAIKKANKKLKKDIFKGPLVPDTAFSEQNRKNFKYFVCMYHDQGLIPLKALHFFDSINVTLNKSIIRTSVDHGTAFDKAYNDSELSLLSYINAVKKAVE